MPELCRLAQLAAPVSKLVIGNTLLFAECHAGEAGSLAFGHDLLPVVLSMAIYLLYIKLLEALYFSR